MFFGLVLAAVPAPVYADEGYSCSFDFTVPKALQAYNIDTYQGGDCDNLRLGLFENFGLFVSEQTPFAANGARPLRAASGNWYTFTQINGRYQFSLTDQVAEGIDTFYLHYYNGDGEGEGENAPTTVGTFTLHLTAPPIPPVPTVTAISPSSGRIGGGASVTISGAGFGAVPDNGAVKFGNATAEYTVVSDSQITATSPAANGEGTVAVTVTTAGGTSPESNNAAFTYVAAPVITGLSTSEGPTSGNFTVKILGSGFSNVAQVLFGSNAALFEVNGDGEIHAYAPSHDAGTVYITLRGLNGTSAANDASKFTYKAPASSDATLSSLAFPNVSLSPTFSSGTEVYRATVPNSQFMTTAIPTATDPDARVEVNGQPVLAGSSSNAINLEPGENTVIVKVTAPDETTTKTYTVIITRQEPDAQQLSLLPADGTSFPLQVGQYFQQMLVPSGGVGIYAFGLDPNGDDLPPGIHLSSDGMFSGSPTAAGDSYVRIVLVDNNGENRVTNTYHFSVSEAPEQSLTLAPSDGTTIHATKGVFFRQAFIASGGSGSYHYFVTGAVPQGLMIEENGTISGTPTLTGTYYLSYRVMDAADPSLSVEAKYTLIIDTASSTSFTFSPASGSRLTAGMAGEEYDASITATGGSGELTYRLESGDLPDGLSLDASTGELKGTVDEGADIRDYTFTISATDSNDQTGSATYTLTIKTRTVTAADKVVSVSAGSSPLNVNLVKGATGGPFVNAEMTYVEPANAGTVAIVNGEFAQSNGPTAIGWYLKFTPNSSYQGEVRVGYRLTSALGVSNTGTVTYMLAADAAKVAEDIDHLVHGFVQSRQNLIANSVHVPGLMERRQMANATDPVTARMMPSDQGMTVSFSTSLAQIEAARDNADGLGGGNAELSPFNIWIDGTFLAHSRDENDGKWGAFAMISAGADYLLTDKALVGLSVHYDRMTDPTEEDAELTGNGWLAGPYASLEIGKGVFWDTSLLYGGSANDIDTAFWDGNFDTSRWLFDTSVSGRWNLDAVTTIQPKLRAIYLSEKVDDYIVENDGGDVIGLDGFTEEQLRVSIGAEIARVSTLENDMTLTRKFGGTVGYSAVDGSGMFGSVTAGLSLQMADGWSIDGGLLFNIEGDGDKSVGGKVGVSGRM
ncbi:IPT/TIG domain-containing protein [Rhizobium viscosum]|uniref:IPT/TIG domain-containing protein n=1 Tax=Rhizobium viscosum TaxID=1673 RepID=UPI0028B142F3|nr:IPT/TIG domain-containing protein [Rhizobium viscosum]